MRKSAQPKERISPERLDGLLARLPREAPIDYRRHALSLPALPPGVAGKQPAMAMDDALQGNFNFLNTAGGAAGYGLYFPGYPWLAELAQRSEYRQPVETLAKEMTRKWITFKSKGKGDKKDRIAEITDEFERFNIQLLFRKGTEHDGFFGLGNIFVAIKGQGDPDKLKLPLELTPATVERDSLLGFTTVEPMWMTPLMWNSNDATRPDFYVPQSWMVLGKEIHASRLLTFVSRPVPDIIKPAYNFGGESLTQLIEPYVMRWLKTVDAVNKLISNFSIINLGTDMGTVLSGGDQGDYENLITRLKFFTQERNNQGVFLTDKERELLTQLSVPLAGLSDLQQQALEHMAYPTHEPLVVLTGVSPSGLNATSEFEMDAWHNWVHSLQEQIYRPNLKKVLELVQLNKWGAIDEDITFDFEPLKELDGEAQARNKKSDAERDSILVDMGAVAPDEVREKVAHDRDSGFTNLDLSKEITPPALEQMDRQAEHDSKAPDFKDSDD